MDLTTESDLDSLAAAVLQSFAAPAADDVQQSSSDALSLPILSDSQLAQYNITTTDMENLAALRDPAFGTSRAGASTTPFRFVKLLPARGGRKTYRAAVSMRPKHTTIRNEQPGLRPGA